MQQDSRPASKRVINMREWLASLSEENRKARHARQIKWDEDRVEHVLALVHAAILKARYP